MAGLRHSLRRGTSLSTSLTSLGVRARSQGGGGALRRALAYGANAHYNLDTTGAAQWSFLSRDPYSVPIDIKAGDKIDFLLPLWTLPSVSNQIVETDLAEAYDFQLSMEYPYADSSTSSPTLANRTRALTTGGQATYSYLPGQGERIAAFSVTAPVDIPAGQLFGGILLHECVAGRSGGVTNKRILRPDNASTFLGRKNGSVNSTTSLIASDATMTRTAFTANSAAQTGLTGSMLIGAVVVTAPNGTPAIFVNGNSIEQGSNEGTSNSGTVGDAIGDAGGDLRGNRGWATRTAYKLNIGVTQMSRGSDSVNDRMTNGFSRRLEFAQRCNPSSYIDLNPHNDTSQTNAPAWSSKAWLLDDVCTANGNAYVCDQAGTSGATAPNGTGANIADGTVLWTYAGPNDGPATAPSWLGKMRKYLRQVKAALPGVKLIGVTCPPDSTSTANASAVNYDSGTGALTLTIADASKLSVGGNVRISGLTPSGLNTSGIANTPITAINGNDITVTRPTGLAAPTGTAAVGLTWTDPSYQTPKSGYTTATSFRSWANRCIRTNPNGVLPYDGIADIGKWAESGNPTTPGTETGKWDKLLTGGVSLGSKMTSDGTHPTSFGNDYLATQMATQEPALAALLLAA